GITLHLSKEITKIDRIRRSVETADGVAVGYDRLLLATGSNPIVLTVPGHTLPGVITYRDIHDTHAMISAAASHEHAVVIGGGLLGLEAANGLKQRGMKVTVVHLADWLMERQLDRTAGNLLQKSLEERGLSFRVKAQTKELVASPEVPDGRVCAIRIVDGAGREETLPADLGVMAVGIRPNTTLAPGAGLHCERGIVVSDTLQPF